MSSRADRVKAILTDLGYRLGSDSQNEQRLKKFLDDNGYRGINNINFIKQWYDDLKTKYKRQILKHFNVEFTNNDLDSKLNELLRDHHLGVQDPTFGRLIKWYERTKTKRSQEISSSQQPLASN